MHRLFDGVVGTRLDRETYKEEFRELFFWAPGIRFLKLEAQQAFAEPGDPSWEAAFVGGDWEKALRLIDEKRTEYEQDKQQMRDLGITSRRLRVVRLPLSPYLQWELQVLRLMGAICDEIRVLDVTHLQSHPAGGVLPEVVVIDGTTTYEVLYDDTGKLSGAIRRTDASLAASCRELISGWYEKNGDDVGEFCDRHLPQLPPPGLPR